MATHKYSFSEKAPFASVEATLLLALWALESIYGESAVRLDAPHVVDEDLGTVAIDGSTAIGRTLNKLFVGFLSREYGHKAFRVARLRTEACLGLEA